MKQKTTHQKISKMVQLALLTAIVVVIQILFASVKIGPVTIAFSLVPIVLTGIFLGPIAGLLIGTISGIVTFIQVFTSADPFYVFLITNNIWATALICVLKAAMAGWLAGIVYYFVKRFIKEPAVNTIFPAIVCPVINTGLFCLGMLVFFAGSFKSSPDYMIAAEDMLYFIFIILPGINFVFELVSTVVLTPVISKALIMAKVFKQ